MHTGYFLVWEGVKIMQNISDIKAVLTHVFDDYGISRAVLFTSFAKGTATEKSDIDLLVEIRLHGLHFVGFIKAVRQAAGIPIDVLDVSHIENGSKIDHKIRDTVVII